MTTYTLTFGDCAESHAGMQIIGSPAKNGLELNDLKTIQQAFEADEYKTKLYALDRLLPNGNTNAYLLIISKGIEKFVDANALYAEQKRLDKDKKALMNGVVVNKKARYNLCFSDFSQDACFEKGRGTVVCFNTTPYLKKLRDAIGILSPKLHKLQCEANYYEDIQKQYIGYHGDSERKIVVGCRLGADFPLLFQWYIGNQKIGKPLRIMLHHSDMYLMSEKATGNDWLKKNIPTLRHAAGFAKNIEKMI